jgi:hypothetical protein
VKTIGLPFGQGFVCAISLLFSSQALAFDEGDWVARFGASVVSPKSDNHSVVDVDDAASLILNPTPHGMVLIWGQSKSIPGCMACTWA